MLIHSSGKKQQEKNSGGFYWKERNLTLICRNELVFTQVKKSFSKTMHNADKKKAAKEPLTF